MDYLLGLLRALVPPHAGDPKLDYRWRLNVAAVCVAAIVYMGVSAALYVGKVPFLPGLARTDHLAAITAQLQADEHELARNGEDDRRQRLEYLATTLDNLRALQCAVKGAKVAQLKQAYWVRIDELMRKYDKLSKVAFDLPACSDVQ